MKRVLLGVVWYLVIVNLVGFAVGFIITFSLAATGNGQAIEDGAKIYSNLQPLVILVSVIIAFLGTWKGILPGTKVVQKADRDTSLKASAPEAKVTTIAPSSKRSKSVFWKIYFWILVVGGSTTYLWQGFSRIWEIVDIAFCVIQMAGLFAFIWERKIVNQLFWKIFFPVNVAWNVCYQYLIPLSEKVAAVGFGGLSRPVAATITFVFFLPLLIALYFYAFKQTSLWKKA